MSTTVQSVFPAWEGMIKCSIVAWTEGGDAGGLSPGNVIPAAGLWAQCMFSLGAKRYRASTVGDLLLALPVQVIKGRGKSLWKSMMGRRLRRRIEALLCLKLTMVGKHFTTVLDMYVYLGMYW
jgi:hypothetical protein